MKSIQDKLKASLRSETAKPQPTNELAPADNSTSPATTMATSKILEKSVTASLSKTNSNKTSVFPHPDRVWPD